VGAEAADTRAAEVDILAEADIPAADAVVEQDTAAAAQLSTTPSSWAPMSS
jgi:hypothetical protein